MAVRWKYLYSSSVGLHIIALIPIRQYFSWFYFLRSERNIESEHLSDEVVNLWIFTVGLTLIGYRPHTSSVWPWSGTPKVRLYGTIICGLRQAFSKSARKPAFIMSSVTLGTSSAPLVYGSVSWAFARASFVASLAFVSTFFLHFEVVLADVLSNRASPASANSAAFLASSWAFWVLS